MVALFRIIMNIFRELVQTNFLENDLTEIIWHHSKVTV